MNQIDVRPRRFVAKGVGKNKDKTYCGWYIQREMTSYGSQHTYDYMSSVVKHYLVSDRILGNGLQSQLVLDEIDPDTLKPWDG